MFQNPDNQTVASIIEDDVAFGPENLGLEPKEIRRRVDEALKSVGMYEYRERDPFRLSGGQNKESLSPEYWRYVRKFWFGRSDVHVGP